MALILCYLVAKVYCKILSSKLKIRLPDSVPPMVSSSFESLIPVIITLVLVCSINYCFTLTSFGNIHALVSQNYSKNTLLGGTGLPALLISQGLAQLLWFFGLHGDQIVGSVMESILQTAGMENLSAHTAGDAVPYIITDQFRALFVMIAFMSLVIFNLNRIKKQPIKKEWKGSSFTSNFLYSEPVVFGAPVVPDKICYSMGFIKTSVWSDNLAIYEIWIMSISNGSSNTMDNTTSFIRIFSN